MKKQITYILLLLTRGPRVPRESCVAVDSVRNLKSVWHPNSLVLTHACQGTSFHEETQFSEEVFLLSVFVEEVGSLYTK